MTDQSNPDSKRVNDLRSEVDRKTTPIKSGIENDPDYLKLLDLYQNAEFGRCQNFVNELERRYPDNPDVKKIKKDLEFKLSISQMNAKNRRVEKRKKVKSILKLVIFGILGVAIVAIALFISFSHFNVQVVQDEMAQQTAQANSLNKLYAQAEELLLFGQPQPALEIIGRIKAIDPNFENLAALESRAEFLITLEAKYQQGVNLQDEGKLDEALLVFSEIEGEEAGLWDISRRIDQIMTTMDVESLLIEGNNAYQAGNWDKVISSYETAMLLDPGVGSQTIDDQLVQAYLNKIITMLQNEATSIEDIEDAEQYFRKVIALIPQNANYSDERGNLQELSTQLLKVKYAQTAKAMLADRMQTTASISRAVSYLTKAANYDPSDSQLQEDLKNANYYQAAFQQFIDMNWESSINNLNAIMSSDLTFAGGNANFLLYEAYYFWGEQYYLARVYEDALQILEQAEIVVWNDTDNLFRLFKLQKLIGDVHGQLDNYENAASYYQYALYAINFGTRLTGHPDITVKYVDAVNAFEDGDYRNAYRGFAEIFEEIDFIFQTKNIEIEKGVCLALVAGEYHSTVDAIIDANNLPDSMVTTAKQTLIIPTITE